MFAGSTCRKSAASVEFLLYRHSEEDRSVSDQPRPRATQFYLSGSTRGMTFNLLLFPRED